MSTTNRNHCGTNLMVSPFLLQYQYSPLRREPNITRLLRLLPSKNEHSPLRCELSTYSLGDIQTRNHLYEALSYT
jgi:hypothetical protein